MSLTNTAPLAAAETARDDAEVAYTNSLALRFPPAMPSFLSTLQAAQAAYEVEVLSRTPGAVGPLSPPVV